MSGQMEGHVFFWDRALLKVFIFQSSTNRASRTRLVLVNLSVLQEEQPLSSTTCGHTSRHLGDFCKKNTSILDAITAKRCRSWMFGHSSTLQKEVFREPLNDNFVPLSRPRLVGTLSVTTPEEIGDCLVEKQRSYWKMRNRSMSVLLGLDVRQSHWSTRQIWRIAKLLGHCSQRCAVSAKLFISHDALGPLE